MRGAAATAGQHAAGRDESGQVVGVGLLTDQDHVLAARHPGLGGRGVEDQSAHGGAGRGIDSSREQHPLGAGVEAGEHEASQLVAGDPRQRLVDVDDALAHEVRGDPERRLGRALAHPCLQHPQPTVLDGELDVAQVLVVPLQGGHHLEQLLVRRRVEVGKVGEGHGVADAGHDVLALGVGEVVAVDAPVARRGVAGEADP